MAESFPARSFTRTLRESFFAFSFDIGGILAGFIIASQLNVFRFSPWTVAIYPAILSARGVISGLFSGRLTTALHMGTVLPRFFGNTKGFYVLFEAIVAITLETSIAMGVLSMFFGIMFWGTTIGDVVSVLAVIMATMFLGLIISILTISVAFASFRKGLDPDIIVYPIMSTVADILITLCYISVLNIFFFVGYGGKYFIYFLGTLLIFLALYASLKNIRQEEFLRTIKESLLTLIIVAFIVNFTGTILSGISEVVGGRKEVYTVYPALIDTVGDVGSVVGSTATTKLALGLLEPSITSIRNHVAQISAAWITSIFMFISFSILALLMQSALTLNAFLNFTTLLLTTNVIAVTAIVLISCAISILAFRRGLDPDNFVIPIESSLADSITSIALFIALFITYSL